MAKNSTETIIFDFKMAKFAFGQTSQGISRGRKSPFSPAFLFKPALQPRARELGEGTRGKFCLFPLTLHFHSTSTVVRLFRTTLP